MRLRDVQAETGYSKPSIYRKERKGQFPKRIKLGPGQGGAVGWRAADVLAWVDARAEGREWEPGNAAPGRDRGKDLVIRREAEAERVRDGGRT